MSAASSADDKQSVRVVVTDFGLARSTLSGDPSLTLPQSSEMIGTPAYMAPEQVESGAITPATDMYALGIVMYEMLTGRLPFTGDSNLAVAVQRLHATPRPPRDYVPDIAPVWETCILRCLERQPSDRFAAPDELIFALTDRAPRDSVVAAEGAPVWPHRSGAILRVAVIVIFLAGVIAAIFFFRNPAATEEVRSRRSVAVLGFVNLTGQDDVDWLSGALSEMLTTELAAGERLRTISSENLARMRVDLSLPESSGFAPDTLAKIRNYIGGDIVVVG
jgi:hypothetical protein